MKTVFALAAAVAVAMGAPNEYTHTRQGTEAIMSAEMASQSHHGEWLQRLQAADSSLFTNSGAFGSGYTGNLGTGFTGSERGFGTFGAGGSLPANLRQQPIMGLEGKEFKWSPLSAYGQMLSGEQKWTGDNKWTGLDEKGGYAPIQQFGQQQFGGYGQDLKGFEPIENKEFNKEYKDFSKEFKGFEPMKELKEFKESGFDKEFKGEQGYGAIQQGELVPQSYTVGAVSLDQARLMGTQAAQGVPLPHPQPITANLQHLPATTKQALTAKQQTEQPIKNQAIYQTYEQRVLQPLQQTVRQPVIQPVLQPVIQPVIQQAQPVVQPMVERVVRPFVIRQVQPQLSTQVQKGAPLQPIVQEPMITGQKSTNAQQAIMQTA